MGTRSDMQRHRRGRTSTVVGVRQPTAGPAAEGPAADDADVVSPLPARRSAVSAAVSAAAVEFLRSAAVGTRVVARHRIPGGLTDALGYLSSSDASGCVIRTRRADVRVEFSTVVLAKQVPPPPVARRGGRPAAGRQVCDG